MSKKESNKLIAAILLAILIAMIIGFIANILYKPDLQTPHRGYSIAVQKTSTTPNNIEVSQTPINIPELIKNANADNGQLVAKKCVMCHSLNKDGKNKIGPHLWNVAGRPKAKVADYKYSNALLSLSGVWDDKSLFDFLHKPNGYVPGTKMSFAGLSKAQDIADIILFLKIYAHDK